jgi:hypothetical protein
MKIETTATIHNNYIETTINQLILLMEPLVNIDNKTTNHNTIQEAEEKDSDLLHLLVKDMLVLFIRCVN